MSTLYEITEDMEALRRLVDEAVNDESGETVELTDEETAAFTEWLNETQAAFETKFNNVCRFSKNLKHEADMAEAERASFKAEMDRLSQRAKAAQARADRVKNLIHLAFDKIGVSKYKTAYFQAGIQNTPYSVKTNCMFDPSKIPDKYLKKELNITAVKEAIKAGELYQKDDSSLDIGKLFTTTGEALTGVSYQHGKTLVIR
jgi:hypothetical protein